jgi:amino-acid N-acetyltransferase
LVSPPAIAPATAADLPAVRQLLRHCALSTEGLEQCLDGLLVARVEDEIIGCAAVERHGPEGLLRSVAVAADRRGGGAGRRLAEAAVEHARVQRLRTLYLLTETGAGFFERLGFSRIARTAVPETIRRSDQFARLCPESALAMRLALE